jgi:outer membrane protein assembly factor BamE (lipoprotein component of BamABCDE complex)
MTQEMLDVLEVVNEDYLKQEFLFCQAQYLKAFNAENINLPCTAASGLPVIHKTRLEMNTIKFYWERRRDAVKEFLPKDSKDFVLKVLGDPISINKSFNRYYFKTGSFDYVEFDKNNVLTKWSNLNKFITIPANNNPIKIGSTKLEVINAMGAPTSITDIAFTFGDARVNFDKNGKVVSYVNGKNNKVNIKGL